MNKNPFNIHSLRILFFIFTLIIATASYANDIKNDKQSDLGQIQKKIDAINEQIKENTKTKKGLSKDLKKQEKKISKTKKEIYKIRKKEKKTKKKLRKLKSNLKKLHKEIVSRKIMHTEIIYQSYIKPKPGYLQMFLEGVNPNEISREINYIGYLTRTQNENLKKINHTYKKIKEIKDLTNHTIKKITTLKNKKLKNKKKLLEQKKGKKKVLKKITSKLKSQKETKQKLLNDEKKLTKIIQNLIAKSKLEIKKRIKMKKIVPDNQLVPDSKLDSINFAKLKKKLKLPVRGKIINKFGSKRKDTGVSWKGIFIASSEGSEVYAVAKGRVVFSDHFRGFGNIIIIDHGKDYMSLYGNNQSLIKKINDIVKGGDVIALVGNSGGNKINGLYYELRKKSIPFDPLKWTNLK